MSCGCSVTVDKLNSGVRERISGAPKLSRSNFRRGDILELALFTYYLNPKGLREALGDLGITLDAKDPYSDLKELSEANTEGLDVNGSFVNENDQPINFNLRKVLGRVSVSKKQLVNNPIIFV